MINQLSIFLSRLLINHYNYNQTHIIVYNADRRIHNIDLPAIALSILYRSHHNKYPCIYIY